MIKNINDWWKTVDENWFDLLSILSHHLNIGEMAYIIPGDSSSGMTGRDICCELQHIKEHRDQRLARYLFAAWSLSSEIYARSCVSGWDYLCELLSEEWVFQE